MHSDFPPQWGQGCSSSTKRDDPVACQYDHDNCADSCLPSPLSAITRKRSQHGLVGQQMANSRPRYIIHPLPTRPTKSILFALNGSHLCWSEPICRTLSISEAGIRSSRRRTRLILRQSPRSFLFMDTFPAPPVKKRHATVALSGNNMHDIWAWLRGTLHAAAGQSRDHKIGRRTISTPRSRRLRVSDL